VRQMTWHLRAEGHLVNEKRIRRLMRLMGPMPIYQRLNTSRKAKGHKTWPYLLRGLAITRPNQVWCADVTYIPMRRGFLYLVAIMDWATRKVLTWRLSNTLEADFCIEALEEALARFGPPEIMNTDQGSQFTSWVWTDRLRRAGVKISMDGKGRFLDNIFVERLWRSLKYECVYLHAWSGGSEARAGIGRWIEFYNNQRPHTALAALQPRLQPDRDGLQRILHALLGVIHPALDLRGRQVIAPARLGNRGLALDDLDDERRFPLRRPSLDIVCHCLAHRYIFSLVA
jgi:putative transposase